MSIEDYGLFFSPNRDKPYRFLGTELKHKNKLEQLLGLVGTSLQSPSPVVTASLFAKYYSYALIAGGLYSLIHLGEKLDLSLNNISLETGEKWSPSLVLDQKPIGMERGQGKKETLDLLFLENLQPVYDNLVDHTGIKRQVLWAHASYAVNYLSRKWREEAQDDAEHIRLEEDFQLILSTVEDLQIEFTSIDHPLFRGEKLTLRKECCLRSCLPNASSCTTCPNIEHAVRKDLLVEYHAKG
ncbi:IucA/IucC family C-terminal-domain containing protein [Ammoniphilus sp. 3BR4]|uniref:IucA/IucC family C-terminal-domain containing protein n=1 Tax=Ammoniphilus sp. 3BR4 TaxID=3158265 RepID=UPI0034677E7A